MGEHNFVLIHPYAKLERAKLILSTIYTLQNSLHSDHLYSGAWHLGTNRGDARQIGILVRPFSRIWNYVKMGCFFM